MAILRVRDENGNVVEILALRGEQGAPGPAYELTEADKAEMVNAVLESLPTAEGVSY